jgi:hypothetical protein
MLLAITAAVSRAFDRGFTKSEESSNAEIVSMNARTADAAAAAPRAFVAVHRFQHQRERTRRIIGRSEARHRSKRRSDRGERRIAIPRALTTMMTKVEMATRAVTSLCSPDVDGDSSRELELLRFILLVYRIASTDATRPEIPTTFLSARLPMMNVCRAVNTP